VPDCEYLLVIYEEAQIAKSLSLTQQTFDTMETTSPKNHIGRKILRIRELRGMKQEILADAIGVSQQTISLLENSQEVDDKRLKQIAEALGVSLEAIKNFSEENVINYFNTFGDHASGQNFGHYATISQTFNPLDKMVELFEENRKLYERLLEAEKGKIVYLEKLLDK
jgi:transcriptional regulator with XRE-family HTH domain